MKCCSVVKNGKIHGGGHVDSHYLEACLYMSIESYCCHLDIIVGLAVTL